MDESFAMFIAEAVVACRGELMWWPTKDGKACIPVIWPGLNNTVRVEGDPPKPRRKRRRS